MSERYSDFENDLIESLGAKNARQGYKEELLLKLQVQPRKKLTWFSQIAWGWKLSTAVILIMAVILFAFGPNQVLAQIRSWLNYLPNQGYVDPRAQVRVLREPVKTHREGITVEAYSALLTPEETFLEYSVFGLSKAAFPTDEADPGCLEEAYLLLEDGSILAKKGASYPAVPAGVSSAKLVIPCLINTMKGAVPENWELLLHFVNSDQMPAGLPLVEEKPLPNMTDGTKQSEPETAHEFALEVLRVIETPKGYTLIGSLPFEHAGKRYEQLSQMPLITDANGKPVQTNQATGTEYLSQEEIRALRSRGLDYWVADFNISKLTFPLTLRADIKESFLANPDLTAELSLDLGQEPAIDVAIPVNQKVELAAQSFTLLSITPRERGYSFAVQLNGSQKSVGVDIQGLQALGAGGGMNPETLVQTTSLEYETRPESPLMLIFSYLIYEGETSTLSTTWQPQTTHAPLPPEEANGLCLNANSFDLPSLDLLNGDAKLLTSDISAPGQRKIQLSGLQGQDAITLTNQGAFAQISADGSKAYYSDGGYLGIFDIANKTTTNTEIFAKDLFKVSPDGSHVAYLSLWADGSSEIDISAFSGGFYGVTNELGAEPVGWSADSKLFYYLVPSQSRDLWKLMSFELGTTSHQELLTLTDASFKMTSASLSPDGRWIRYRGRDNSSVHLISIDGASQRILAEGITASGFVWVSPQKVAIQAYVDGDLAANALLVDLETCQLQRIPLAEGQSLEGLYLP